jgi:pimeloyl-ACP methyl ester carboxylesterase
MYRKLMLFISLLLYTPFFALAQLNTGLDAIVGKVQMFFNSSQYDSIYNMLSARSQGLMPQDKIKSGMAGLHSQTGEWLSFGQPKMKDNIAYYKVKFQNATLTLITGIDANNKIEKFGFVPYKDETQAEESNFILNSPTGKIFGTLTTPPNTTKVPVVLLIAGSGPTDRNCNGGDDAKTNTYKILADSLLKAGIACLRFDKRGVGESIPALGNASMLTFDMYVDDVAGFVKMLGEDTRFSEVIVAGHSEGSLIGMIAAQKGGVKKYISIAGAGGRIDKTLKDQYATRSKEMADAVGKMCDTLMMGKDLKYVPDALSNLFNPVLQTYIRSWLKYDPQVEIKKLQVPILIIQGDNDMQVSMKNANNLKKAAPGAQLVYIKKMSHVLKDAPTDREANFASYNHPDMPLSPGFASALIKFIRN